MRIEKKYKFYAAHRNQNLSGKCQSLHGHRYGLTVVVKPERTTVGITMLFEQIDNVVDPVVKMLDHACLLDVNDPISETISAWGKVYEMPSETSAENLAEEIFCLLRELDLPVVEVRLQETDSAVVIYDLEDYGSNN